jgi:hypothetical protein
MGEVTRGADRGSRALLHPCLAVHAALVCRKDLAVTLLARHPFHGLRQGLGAHGMAAMAIGTYRGISVALGEQIEVDAPAVLGRLVQMTSSTGFRAGDRYFTNAGELSVRMFLLREMDVTVGTPVPFVYRMTETLFANGEGKRFSVDGKAELLFVAGEAVLSGSELFFLGRDFSDGMGTMAI